MDVSIADPAKCEIRAVIRFLHAKKVSPIEIHRQLKEVYGDNCMSVQHVRKWCREFTEGRKDVHDEPRSGRPSTSDDVVAKVQRVLLEDRRITIEELALRVPEVSAATLHRIVTENLGYNKICARWVPHMLTAEHKQQRVDCARMFLEEHEAEGDEFLDAIITADETWCHYYTPETKQQSKQWKHTSSPSAKKFKATKSAGKVMATVFWDRHGVILVDFMERGTTINSDQYCEILEKLRRAIQNRRRGRLTKGVWLHHDNARVHTSRKTTALLVKFGWDIVPHPPYSPDLAPCDFHLFPKLKNYLAGQRFADDEEVQNCVKKYLKDLAAEEYEAGFAKWIKRLKKCMEVDGDYVEK